MRQQFDVALWTKDAIFLNDILFEVDPKQLIINTKPVKKLSNLYVALLILEGKHVSAKFSKKVLEGVFCEILFFKEGCVAKEDVEGERNVLFRETLQEKLIHEEVDLFHRVELLHIQARRLYCQPREVSVTSFPHVSVLDNVLHGSLFPAVLNIPIEFALNPLFNLFFVFCSVLRVATLSKLGALLLKVFPSCTFGCKMSECEGSS